MADSIRSSISDILRKASPAYSNIIVAERETLQSLKKAQLILSADRGQATVVMKNSEYEEKASSLLVGGQYKILRQNPTLKYERKLNSVLRLKYPTEPQNIFWFVCPSGNHISSFCGLRTYSP